MIAFVEYGLGFFEIIVGKAFEKLKFIKVKTNEDRLAFALDLGSMQFAAKRKKAVKCCYHIYVL